MAQVLDSSTALEDATPIVDVSPCDCCGGRGLTTTSEPVPVPKQQEREPRRGKAAPKTGKAATTRKKSASSTRSKAKAEPATPEAPTDGDATV